MPLMNQPTSIEPDVLRHDLSSTGRRHLNLTPYSITSHLPAPPESSYASHTRRHLVPTPDGQRQTWPTLLATPATRQHPARPRNDALTAAMNARSVNWRLDAQVTPCGISWPSSPAVNSQRRLALASAPWADFTIRNPPADVWRTMPIQAPSQNPDCPKSVAWRTEYPATLPQVRYLHERIVIEASPTTSTRLSCHRRSSRRE